jgi:hypothetical protein
MNHFKAHISIYPKSFGISLCIEKMMMSHPFRYRLDFQLFWIHISLLMFKKHTSKF